MLAIVAVFRVSALLAGAAMATVWLRFHAGPWPAWLIGAPVLVALNLILVDEIAVLLPGPTVPPRAPALLC